MAEKIKKVLPLTEKMVTILHFMANEGADVAYFAADVADGTGLGAKSVSPVLTGLANRGLVAKGEGEREVVLKKGKETKVYKTYTLTEAGVAAAQ